MRRIVWLIFLLGFAATAESRVDFPLSHQNLLNSDKYLLFEKIGSKLNSVEMLTAIVAEFPDLRVITWPAPAKLNFKDTRVSEAEQTDFLKLLKDQRDPTSLGVFVPAEFRSRPLSTYSVLAFRAEPARATILHELLHAMLNRVRPRESLLDEHLRRECEELEIVSFLVDNRVALKLDEVELLPQIEDMLVGISSLRKYIRDLRAGSTRINRLESSIDHTVRRLGRLLQCAANLSEEE